MTQYFGDISPFGVVNMAGNVEEWCLDGIGEYADLPTTNPIGPYPSTRPIVRGGEYYQTSGSLFTTYSRRFADATEHSEARGFRCVYTPPAGTP